MNLLTADMVSYRKNNYQKNRDKLLKINNDKYKLLQAEYKLCVLCNKKVHDLYKHSFTMVHQRNPK